MSLEKLENPNAEMLSLKLNLKINMSPIGCIVWTCPVHWLRKIKLKVDKVVACNSSN